MPSRRHIKKTSKNDTQNEPKLVPQWGPKVEPKSPKMMSWGHLRTRVAPERPPDPLQDQFWRCFGTICGPFLTDFPTHLKSFLDAMFSSMLQTHTFKIIWSQTKHAPDTAPTSTQQSKPRSANPRVLQRTERLLEEGPAAVGVALKIDPKVVPQK